MLDPFYILSPDNTGCVPISFAEDVGERRLMERGSVAMKRGKFYRLP